MRLPITSEFLDEAERFALCFTCEDCAHFDGAGERCRHEWPTGLHRSARYRAVAGEPPTDEVVFCKEFEIE